MSLHTVAKITGVEKENEIVTTFTLDAKLETEATPGQFVMLWLPGFDEKPYSVAGVSPLTISVGARGPFSKKLCSMKKGGRIWVRGPYGRGFELKGKSILLVGGGYGFAPLRYLASEAKKKKIAAKAICGARAKGLLMLPAPCETVFTTDDGSEGRKGNVLVAMEDDVVGPRALSFLDRLEMLRIGQIVNGIASPQVLSADNEAFPEGQENIIRALLHQAGIYLEGSKATLRNNVWHQSRGLSMLRAIVRDFLGWTGFAAARVRFHFHVVLFRVMGGG